MNKIYILTGPFNIGSTMTGMGYRYWELAKGLRLMGIPSILVLPEIDDSWDYEGIERITSSSFIELSLKEGDKIIFSLEEKEEILEKIQNSESNLIFDNVLTPYESIQFQKVMDHGISAQQEALESRIEKLKKIISRSNFHLVGTPEEKLYIIGQLTTGSNLRVKDIESLPERIDVLPIPFFSKDSIGYQNKPQNLIVNEYLWNGGLWNHYKVDFILEAFSMLNNAAEMSTVMHFMYRNNTDKYREIYEFMMSGNPFIKIPGPEDEKLGYREKISILNRAKGIILTNENSVQSQLVLPLRMREALLHIKPMIVSDYGLLSKYVKENGLGLTIENTPESLISAIDKFNDQAFYESLLDNINDFREKFDIENNLSIFKSYIDEL